MRTFATLFLSFAASALAYSVTGPTETKGWTNSGPQTLTWTRVSTDRLNFTVVLNNQNSSPAYSQVLASLVDGTLNTAQLNPPSAGWPLGDGFRVNLVENSENLNTILAQSDQFNITTPTSTSATGSSTLPRQTGTTLIATTTGPAAGATTSKSSVAGSPSDDPNAPPAPNGAIPVLNTQNGLIGALAVLGLFLV